MAKALSRRPAFRAPILILALVNLVVLGARLWPWSEVLNLPGSGATGIDPGVALLGYGALAFWVGTARTEPARTDLYRSGWMGLAAAGFLLTEIYLSTRPAENASPMRVHAALFAAAAVLWGLCAVRAVRGVHALGFAVVCSVWSALVSCLVACLALLAGSFYALAPGQTADAWKQYQGLAIGSDETQALVHTLLTATGFLLIGPIVAGLSGAVCGALLKPAHKQS